MVRIAAVEDTAQEADRLKQLLADYFAAAGESFTLDVFPSPVQFLSSYRENYDIIFMDIDLPDMDGMTAAHRLREVDQEVILIFVTRMAQYAIGGYEVNAMDYLLKPLTGDFLAAKMDRALARLRDSGEFLLITSHGGARRVLLREILYIEVQGHTLSYHTGIDVLHGSGSLTELESSLKGKGFLRCSKCYLVNSRHIGNVYGYDLHLDNGEILQISRLRKTAFMTDLAQMIGKR